MFIIGRSKNIMEMNVNYYDLSNGDIINPEHDFLEDEVKEFLESDAQVNLRLYVYTDHIRFELEREHNTIDVLKLELMKKDSFKSDIHQAVSFRQLVSAAFMSTLQKDHRTIH